MDIPAGMLLGPGNLPHWHNTPIRDLISEACSLPVTYANDANAAAYGEFWAGAGRDYRSLVLFTLGTGIGGGIVVEGMLVEGMHSCGGELGHIIIDSRPDAPLNSLGIRGTLEGYCGAYSVIRRTEEELAAGGDSSLRKRVGQGEELTPKMLAEEAEAGDRLSMDIIMETARYMAIGTVTAIHTIDPDSVVIGGAMTFGGAGHPLGEKFMTRLREEARSRLIASIRDKVHIDFATLGGDAGYIGAAGLARREHLEGKR
jgi:glucokinase